jgi:predicted negative regulator of RcsB-dependent stress response
LGGIVLGVGGWWGYQHYQSHKNEVALRAADRFTQMTSALQSDDANKPRQIAEGLV